MTLQFSKTKGMTVSLTDMGRTWRNVPRASGMRRGDLAWWHFVVMLEWGYWWLCLGTYDRDL